MRNTARRADNFLKHISNLKLGTLVRAGIVEGAQASSTDDEASSVSRRWLDPEPWHLSLWEPLTSTSDFARGMPQEGSQTADDDSEARASGQSPADNSPASDPETIADDLNDIIRSDRSETEEERLVAARIGQGRFRKDVLARWDNACAVTGTVTLAALRASHCKPWRESNDAERLDPANGLPLTATLDALFDVGLIAFDDDGPILVSSLVDDPYLDIAHGILTPGAEPGGAGLRCSSQDQHLQGLRAAGEPPSIVALSYRLPSRYSSSRRANYGRPVTAPPLGMLGFVSFDRRPQWAT
jgi:hypothetical protein